MPTTKTTVDKAQLLQERTDLVARLAALTADMQTYPNELQRATASGNLGAYGGILQNTLIAPIASTTLQVKLARVEALLAASEKRLPKAKRRELVESFKGARERAQAELATGVPEQNGTRAAMLECIAALDEAISALGGK